MMKRALLFSCAVACGGGNATTTATSPTPSASSQAAADTQTTTPPPDDSPASIGNRHKKIGSGWFLSGGGKDFYDAIYEPGAEPVVVVKQTSSAGSTGGRWVTLMKNVAAAPYVGKKIRIRVGVKTSGMSSNMTRAELWARAAGPHQAEDAPSTKVPLGSNAEMKTYEVTIDVKDNARVIEYGASIAGDGELRVARDAIDVL